MSLAFADVTVPVDRSTTSQRGVDVAIDLARSGTHLHFCSVVNATALSCAGAMGTPFDPAPVIEALESEARDICDEAVATAKRSGVAADGTVLFGSVVETVCGFSADRGSDALVLGTHARRGTARVLFGSVAEGLMQRSGVPVIVAHPDDERANDGPIAVALDGSASSLLALRAAIDLAREQKRRLALVTVVETERPGWSAAALALSDAADIVRAAEIDFESATLHGSAADTIVASAQRFHSPLLVVGTRGHAGAKRFLLGSVAAAVVERAHVPVMVVRDR